MSVQAPPQDPTIQSEVPHEPPPWSRRQWAVAVIVLASAIALAAIPLLSQLTADDDAAVDEPAVTTTTATVPTTVTTTPTTAPPVEDLIRARYFEFWRVHDAYGSGTGPFDPAEFKALFEPVATDGEYEHLFKTFQLLRLKGYSFRGGRPLEQELSPRVSMVAPDQAVVSDCVADTGEIYNVSTGEVIERANDGRETYETTIVRGEDGIWRVAAVGGSRRPCAL